MNNKFFSVFVIIAVLFNCRNLPAQSEADISSMAYHIVRLPAEQQKEAIEKVTEKYSISKEHSLSIKKTLNIFVDGFSVFLIKKDAEQEGRISKLKQEKNILLYEAPYLDDPFANNAFRRLGNSDIPDHLSPNEIKITGRFTLTPLSEDYADKTYKIIFDVKVNADLKEAAPGLESQLTLKANNTMKAVASGSSFSNFTDAKIAYKKAVAQVVLDIEQAEYFIFTFCSMKGYEKAALLFKEHLDDVNAEDIKQVKTDQKVKITAKLYVGENRFLSIEKDFDAAGSVDAYIAFLKNWKVEGSDADLVAYKGYDECLAKFGDGLSSNWERNPPVQVTFMADVLMGAPGTIYGWYTGEHWRTEEKLEKWEQVLGVLDLIPGEALAKIGIVNMVTGTGVVIAKYAGKGVATAVKLSFKVGDKIAGISISRIKAGSNGKIAIIGRAMGNADTKGVRDVYNELRQKGIDVEIFDQSALKGDWKLQYDVALKEMEALTDNWKIWLNNNTLIKTKLYKLNKEWTEMLVNDGYEIIDMGDIYLKSNNYKGMSLFYAIEKSILFK